MASNINNIDLNDFNNLCRTCMSNCDVKFSQDIILSNIFYKLTEIHFQANEELPQQVCLNCYEKIHEIHKFALQCKQTHSSLLECLNNFKNAGIYVKQELLEETNDPLKTEEEITIDEHKLEFLKDEISNSENKYDIEEVKLENVFEENIIPGESDDHSNNCSKDNLSRTNTMSKNGQIKEEINETENTNDSNKRRNLSNSCDTSYIKSAEKNIKETKELQPLANLKRSYECNHCDRTFSYSSHLKTHILTHTGERPFKCNQCEKSFNSKQILKRHTFSFHSGQSFNCKQCGKTYKRSDDFNMHILTHSDEPPNKCKQCGKIFLRPMQLKLHMFKHTGERPFKCNQCEKSFCRADALKSHTFSQHGEQRGETFERIDVQNHLPDYVP